MNYQKKSEGIVVLTNKNLNDFILDKKELAILKVVNFFKMIDKCDNANVCRSLIDNKSKCMINYVEKLKENKIIVSPNMTNFSYILNNSNYSTVLNYKVYKLYENFSIDKLEQHKKHYIDWLNDIYRAFNTFMDDLDIINMINDTFDLYVFNK